MVDQNLESDSKNPLRPTKVCCFQTMPRALDVLHSTASSALFAIFLRCLLLTPHGPISAGATSRGKSFPSSEAPIRPVEATERSTFPGWNRSNKWRQTMEKWKNKSHLIDMFVWKSFWNCHQPFSAMLYFKD